MECRDVEIQLIEFHEGQLNHTDAQRIRDHLEECPRCRAELISIERVLSGLRSQQLSDPGEAFWKEFPQEVRSTLSHDERRHSEIHILPGVWEKMYGIIKGRHILKPVYAAVPIAAIILIVVGLLFFKGDLFRTGPSEMGEESLEGSFSTAGWAASPGPPVLLESLSSGELHYISQELVGWLDDMGNLGDESLLGEDVFQGEDVFATLDGLGPRELGLVYDALRLHYLKSSTSPSVPMGIGGGKFS
jgi:hypothetical protein